MQEIEHISAELGNMNSTLRGQLDRLMAEISSRQVGTMFMLRTIYISLVGPCNRSQCLPMLLLLLLLCCCSSGCCYQIFNVLKLFHFATDRN